MEDENAQLSDGYNATEKRTLLSAD